MTDPYENLANRHRHGVANNAFDPVTKIDWRRAWPVLAFYGGYALLLVWLGVWVFGS